MCALTKLQEKQEEFEIELRGSTLNISIKFESMLMRIIYFSNSEQFDNPQESPTLKIKNLTFGGKLKRAKELLIQFHPDLLAKYQDIINSLDTFLIYRNRMAHCSIHWTDNVAQNFEVWDVAEDDTKLQFYSPVKYTRVEFAMGLVAHLNKIGVPLMNLVIEVQNRFAKSAPHLFSIMAAEIKAPPIE